MDGRHDEVVLTLTTEHCEEDTFEIITMVVNLEIGVSTCENYDKATKKRLLLVMEGLYWFS